MHYQSRRLRLGRSSEPGRVYFITICARNRLPIFADTFRARTASRISDAGDTWGSAKVLAWVVMPDHWHGLIELGNEPLPRVVARFKSSVTRSLRVGAVWQRGYVDCALRRDRDLRYAARYLIANPVRAGLAHTVGGYPYWNAIWL